VGKKRDVQKPEERRPFRIRRRRLENNIKMDLRQIGWEFVDRIHMAQGRDRWRTLARMLMNLRVPFWDLLSGS
jgi:hypothetical protein